MTEGYQFDLGTVALMTVLERQVIDTSEDGDSDDHDRTLDGEPGEIDDEFAPGFKWDSRPLLTFDALCEQRKGKNGAV